MKKMIAFMLTLGLMLILSIPVFAESTSAEDNTASQNVTANYTPSSTGEAAAITGMYITVDGKKYESSTADAPVKIYSDSTVEITLTGTNFADLPDYQSSTLCFGVGEPVEWLCFDRDWEIDTTSNLASKYFSSSEAWSKLTEAAELFYRNDGTKNISSGIYVIADSEKKPVLQITEISIAVTRDGKDVPKNSEGVYVITADSSVKLTIKGKNLDYGSSDHVIGYAEGIGFSLDFRGWNYELNDEGTLLSYTLPGTEWHRTFQVKEILYTVDGYVTTFQSGIKVVYDDGLKEEERAKITGVTVSVDGTVYTSGNIKLSPTSRDVVFTVTGTNFKNLNARNQLCVAEGWRYSGDDENWVVDADKNTAVVTIEDISLFESCDGYKVSYSNDGGGTGIDTGISITYDKPAISVDLTWGSLTFTYSDEIVDGMEAGWSCENNTDLINIANNGVMPIQAEAEYTADESYADISGTFSPNSVLLAGNTSEGMRLVLSGKPGDVLTGNEIGTVTVRIKKPEN